MRQGKYRARKVVVDGETFDSQKEWKRWHDLQILQSVGDITSLTRNKKDCTFVFVINGKTVCKYIADAVYQENGMKVVEDTKSPITRKNREYRIKCKLMEACYGIQIREI